MEKIARICWNHYEWMRPSGPEGKSQSDNSYEKIEGFGHEEWLFDNSKVMPDGYHYSFLQPINVASGKHIGKTYNIHLFTINAAYKKKIYVGTINNVECISTEQSSKAFAYYKKCGWLNAMKEDIRFVGGTVSGFKPEFLFNVRFKFSDVHVDFSNMPIISEADPHKGTHYNLMDYDNEFIFEKDENGELKTLSERSSQRVFGGQTIIIDPLHKKLQNAVSAILKDQYVNLYLEKPEAYGQIIDMKGIRKDSTEWDYFEFKTSSAKKCIREALGQILEYNHYPNSNRAARLFIIGPSEPDENDIKYLQKLRSTYKELKLWYRWYSFEKNELSKEY